MRKQSIITISLRLGLWLLFALLASGTSSSVRAQDAVAAKPPTASTGAAKTVQTSPAQGTLKPHPLDPPSISLLTPTEGVNFSGYLTEVVKIVKLQWYAEMPREARAGQKGMTTVVFRIDRDGSVHTNSLEIERSAGNDALDKAAMDAVNTAGPFEPLPEQFKGDHIELRFVFRYNTGPEDDMKAPQIKTPTEAPPLPGSTGTKPVAPQK